MYPYGELWNYEAGSADPNRTYTYNTFVFELIAAGPPLPSVSAPLHGVLIDVVGDRFAQSVTDGDSAWVVHTAPDPSVVTIRARSRDAGVRAARLSGRYQRKRLLLASKVAEENGCSRTVQAGVPALDPLHTPRA